MARLVRATRAGVTLALPLIVTLTGCASSTNAGIASKSPAQILAASRAAALSSSSVRVVSRASQGRLTVTIQMEASRGSGRASLSLLGLSYEAIRIGSTLYLKGNKAFTRQLARITHRKLTPGTWLKAPADAPQLSSFAALTKLHAELTLLLSNDYPTTRGPMTKLNGQHAVELTQTAKLFTGSLYIATTGKPYPIELLKHGRETGQTTYSNWNQTVRLTAPANATKLNSLKAG